jgi:hypothetical protein
MTFTTTAKLDARTKCFIDMLNQDHLREITASRRLCIEQSSKARLSRRTKITKYQSHMRITSNLAEPGPHIFRNDESEQDPTRYEY